MHVSMASRVTRSGASQIRWRTAVSRWRKPLRASRIGEGWRIAIHATALICALGALAVEARAEQVPAGMIPYSKPVFRNGHLVLWHGPSHGGGVNARAEVAASKTKQFTILVDASEPSQARVAAELSAQAQANGFTLKVISGKTSLAAIGKAVAAHSADFAIAPLDALLAAGKNPPDWKERAPYIARLTNEPIEIVTLRTVTDVSQLAGRKVNVEAADGASAASAALLFSRLNVAPKLTNGFLADALGDLSDGKIDGVLVIGGKASKSLADFSRDTRFHVLSLPWSPAVQPLYSPARLANADQPNLIGTNENVDTLSVGMALVALDAAPASPRAEKFGAFATQFLNHFDALLSAASGSGWRDVNLAAGIEGWPQLAAAQTWVEQGKSDAGHALDGFRTIAQSASVSDQGPSSADSDRLYDTLMKWRAAQ
jgi:uncharacterized protein